MGQQRRKTSARDAPSQTYLLNVCGFRPLHEDSVPLLNLLYQLAGINPRREFGPPPCATALDVAKYLKSVRRSLSQLRGADLTLEFRLLLHMRPDLDDVLEVIAEFHRGHAADMKIVGATSRFRVGKHTGRNMLVLDEGQSEDPNVIQQLADQFDGVLEGPLGEGGVLVTEIGGLITASCSPKERSVSMERFVPFMDGTSALPSRSGIRQRTDSGRLVAPRREEESLAFQHEPPTRPALRARMASIPPVETAHIPERSHTPSRVPVTQIMMVPGTPSSPQITAVRPNPDDLVEIFAADAEDRRAVEARPNAQPVGPYPEMVTVPRMRSVVPAPASPEKSVIPLPVPSRSVAIRIREKHGPPPPPRAAPANPPDESEDSSTEKDRS